MSNNPFSLEGKTILITGASSGIGRSIAIECSRMGAHLILVARNKQRLEEVLLLLHGGGHSFLSTNLISEVELENMVEALPKLDGVASNAGIVKLQASQLSDRSDMEQLFEINTFSHIRLIQLLQQKKKLNKGASIVFTSSMSGVYCGAIGSSLYGSTKAALNGFTKALALELAPRNIRVNVVNPGMINTGLFDQTIISKEQLEEDVKRYPLKRYGKPEEVAYAVVYLLSDATAWMTGSSILLDGGYSVQ
jgi:NAD(P)-dependent dehydrogenase (short-subunit alcohol dehydrogenase family)